jgi:cysteine-rich repeat protein
MVSNIARAVVLAGALSIFAPAISYTAAETATKPITAVTQTVTLKGKGISQDAAGRPFITQTPQVRQVAQSTLSYDVKPGADHTAMFSSVQEPPKHHAQAAPKKSLDACIDCPPTLGPLQPSIVYHMDGEGNKLDSKLQKLPTLSEWRRTNPGEECPREIQGLQACLYPGQYMYIDQASTLTKLQKKLIGEGKARLEYIAQPDRSLTKEQNAANRNIWRDGRLDRQELLTYSEVLPKNDEGLPYSQARIAIRLSMPGIVPCEYIVNERGDLCEYKAPPAPICGDGKINQEWEVCDDGNTAPGDGCYECKPEVVPETPKEPVPVPPTTPTTPTNPTTTTEDKPSIYTNPFYVRGVAGETGFNSLMEWNKNPNQNCPTAACTGMFAQQAAEGLAYSIEAGYKNPDLHVAVEANRTEMDVATTTSHAAIQEFFDVKRIDDTSLTLKARGAINLFDSNVQPYLSGQYMTGEREVADAATTRAFDVDGYRATGGIKVGPYTETHGYIGGGIQSFDQHHLMTAPTYNEGIPGTLRVEGPIAEAGGQLTLLNKHLDLFADTTYTINNTIGDQKVDNQFLWTAGTNIWVTPSNKPIQLGITGDVSNHQPWLLDMPGNPAYTQQLLPDDTTYRAGVTIRFGK